VTTALQTDTVPHNGSALKVLAASYLQEMDLSVIDRAWKMVEEVHGDKKHFSGEPYPEHALAVAVTLASMHLDLDTVLAGLLHGVLKEGVTVETLRREFGETVATIVDGSTKITNVRYNSRLAHQAGNVRKLLLAIAADIRVLLVKLSDRLHDMLLLDMVEPEVREEVARETMDLYAPLAARLGIDWLKRELEDYAFKYLYPEDFQELNSEMESSYEEREAYVDEVIFILKKMLKEHEIVPMAIFGRPKHLYSIHKKLVVQQIPLERVYDKVAFRIIVETVKECYEALGVIHGNWVPVPGRIKDFISVPKANNYQSMHTTVAGPRGHFIEIQIRTEEMDKVAQEGVAAHWAYKEDQKANEKDARLFRELKKLVKSLHEVEDPREFLDSVKGELYKPEVYALTPDGEVKEFPLKSCPIDFAYAVHTEVGNRCAGAKVNGRLVPLKYQLENGDIVEIITSKNQRPRRGWLDLVQTGRARARIRAWLRREEKEKALELGREICEKALKKSDTTLKKMVKTGHIKRLLQDLRCNSLDDMLAKIGLGNITLGHIGKALHPHELAEDDKTGSIGASSGEQVIHSPRKPIKRHVESEASVQIEGIDNMLIKISQCCHPVPGDAIIGFITTGRGVSVHRADCVNLLASDPTRRLDVSWSSRESSRHEVELLVLAEDKKGILTTISGAISEDDADIVKMSAHSTPAETAELKMTIQVTDKGHLKRIIQHLKQMEDVISVRRK